MGKEYKLTDEQFNFLQIVKRDLKLDEVTIETINFILDNRRYTEFHKNTILRDLRSRYIRDSGLHNTNYKYEDELNKANR